MTLAKYNEIMERIEVTDEMKNRVLHNVDTHFQKNRINRMRTWFAVLGTAAAVVILLVISPWRNLVPVTLPEDPNSDETVGIYDMKEYASASELSGASGFIVKEIKNIPFAVSGTSYFKAPVFSGIRYTGNDNVLEYRKSPGTEDNSGDYNEYSTVKTIDVDGVTVTVKGESEGLCLAVWTDGEFAHSLWLEKGIDEEALLALVREIIEK